MHITNQADKISIKHHCRIHCNKKLRYRWGTTQHYATWHWTYPLDLWRTDRWMDRQTQCYSICRASTASWSKNHKEVIILSST